MLETVNPPIDKLWHRYMMFPIDMSNDAANIYEENYFIFISIQLGFYINIIMFSTFKPQSHRLVTNLRNCYQSSRFATILITDHY